MRVIALALVLVVAGCATTWVLQPRVIHEYAGVTVRVYHVGPLRCRIEVVLPTETLQTQTTRCWSVPRP